LPRIASTSWRDFPKLAGYETSIPPVLITFTLVCFAFVQNAQAVSPAPDGGYAGGNTAEGQNSLLSLSSGTYNTAIGIYSLLSLTDGNFCTAVGAGTFLVNTADNNTATGAGALLSNTFGCGNMANGAFALFSNTDGGSNTATGINALLSNTTGNTNTAFGSSAGSDINGSGNVCIGEGVSGEAGVDDSTYMRNVNTTEQGPAKDVAFVTVRLSDGRLGHQPIVMRRASPELKKTVEELKSRVARQETIIAQQQKAMEILTAQFKEPAESNPK
jgi:hypothetical protein